MTTKYIDTVHHSKLLKHLGKSKDHVAEDVETIKKWLKDEKHLPEVPSDTLIRGLLINNKLNVEITKETLNIYYAIRELLPEVFKNSRPFDKRIEEHAKIVPMVRLPKLTPRMQRVIMKKYTDTECVDDYDIFKSLATLCHINEIDMSEDMSLGYLFVVDCLYFKKDHLNKISEDVLKKSSFVVEELWSKNLKEFHIINSSKESDVFIDLIRKYVYEGLKDNVYVHDTLEDFYKFVPKTILPKDYGGDEKTFDELLADWNEKLKEYEHRFEKLDELKVNDKLRSRKYKGKNIEKYFEEKINELKNLFQ